MLHRKPGIARSLRPFLVHIEGRGGRTYGLDHDSRFPTWSRADPLTYPASPVRAGLVVDKPKRLESANFERAEAAVAWEDAANTAAETGRPADQATADARDRALDAADRKIKSIQKER